MHRNLETAAINLLIHKLPSALHLRIGKLVDYEMSAFTNKLSLYLNVFTPKNTNPDSKLPVKFFVYGGSFTSGATSLPLYNGCHLATDAIVVTVAYRLGALGWLSLNSAGISGNMGLEDAILGTQWVQENIAAFGGDPVRLLRLSILS